MEDAADRHPRDRLRRELSLTDATLLGVASVIGSGIFFTPGAVADRIPDPGWILLAWLVGGLLALAGALANAELGAMFPHAGGDYVFLREAFHPGAGFLMGWVSFLAIFTGTVATLAAAFADALTAFVPLGGGQKLGVAVAVTVVMSALNYVGVRTSARFNNGTSAIKIGALAAFAVLGLGFGTGTFANATAGALPPGELPLVGFGLALSPILFSYLGWNATVYVASEIVDPRRNVPRSLFLGLAVCIVLYLAVNVTYLYALPVETMRGIENVGEAAAGALFGPRSGTLLALFVVASVLGTLNATILVGARIAYAIALDGRFFAGADRVHVRFATPHVAIVVQAVVALAILLALRTFRGILDFTTFAIVLATMADTLALFALRRRQPDRLRPYRAWGYPWVPAGYFLANAAIAAVMLYGNPKDTLVCLAVIASGIPFYFWFSRKLAPEA